MKKIEVVNMTEEERDSRVNFLIEAGYDEETIEMTVKFEDKVRKLCRGGITIGNPERLKYAPVNMARALLEVQGYKVDF